MTDLCPSCVVHAVNWYMALRVQVLDHLGDVTQMIQNFEE
jgi:hypothetical protein